jgi:potassium voltage-gated channel Eag-related subfamily H member 8
LQNLLHSTIEPLPEYKTQSLKKSRFILSHYGVFKGFWDWLILSSTFYVAFVVPYNAAFVQTDRLTMASDVIVEALFILGELPAHARQKPSSTQSLPSPLPQILY